MAEIFLRGSQNLITFGPPTDDGASFAAAYPDVADPDMIPSSTSPVTVQWLANGDMRIRTRSVLGGGATDYDEYIERNPAGYSGVTNGRQLIGHRAMVATRPRIWIPTFDSFDNISVQPFTYRLGKFADPYLSGGEGPKYFNDGFSHGNMLYQAGSAQGNSAISIAGDGTNYHTSPPAAGTKRRGTALSIAMNYNLLLGVDASVAARLYAVSDYDALGLRQYKRFEVVATGVGGNDSYAYMYPFYGGDWIKPVGLTGVQLIGDGLLKPVSLAWDSADIDEVQFYSSLDNTVMATIDQLYSQPLRKPDGSLAAYARNQLRRFLVKDNPAVGAIPSYGKYYAFGMSSDGSGSPTAFSLANGEVLESSIRIRTKVKSGGPG